MSFPVTTDGKQIVMTSLFPQGVYLYFAGSADVQPSAGPPPSTGRGQGIPFVVSLTTAQTVTKSFSFNDYVYLSGGKCTWDNALVNDKITLSLAAPATTYTANLGNTGGATLASSGLITPNPGAGNIDVTNAIPVPNTSGNGAWAWVSTAWLANPVGDPTPPTGMGQVIATPPGFDTRANWTYDLYAASVPLANFVNCYQIYGTRTTDFTLPAIKPQMILPQWQISAIVTSGSGQMARPNSNPLVVSWALTVARNATQ